MLDDHASRGTVDLGQVTEQCVRLLQTILSTQFVLQDIDYQLDLLA